MNKQNIFLDNENFQKELLNNILSKNICFITSTGHKTRGGFEKYLNLLKSKDNKINIFYLDRYPELSDIKSLKEDMVNINFIISFGGGSCIDLGKVASIELSDSIIPHIAIPTTSGSGAESTSFATFWDIKDQKKLSIEEKKMLPEYVFLNPEFCVSMPEKLTISTCLDSISHCIDSILSKNVSKESLSLSKSSLRLVIDNIENSLKKPTDQKLRGEILKASNLAGKSINLTKTSLTHSISYPLTYKYHIPHGLACGFSLKQVIEKFYTDLNQFIDSDMIYDLISIIDFFEINRFLKSSLHEIDIEDLYNQILKNSRLNNFFTSLSKEDLVNIITSAHKEYS